MKAHKFKSKLTSREEVWKEWNKELANRTNKKKKAYLSSNGLFGLSAAIDFQGTKECIQIEAAEKLDQIAEWNKRGRNTLFLKDDPTYYFQLLLEQKHYGRILGQPNPDDLSLPEEEGDELFNDKK